MITIAVGAFLMRGETQAAIANQGAADFFVSPRGHDEWSGKPADPGNNDGPFATVARAREAVRVLLKTEKAPRRVRVVLRGGTYYLDSPMEFGPEDSGTEKAPVIYAAAAGEKVVLSGGRSLEGGRWGEVNGRKAWVVDLPQVKDGPMAVPATIRQRRPPSAHKAAEARGIPHRISAGLYRRLS